MSSLRRSRSVGALRGSFRRSSQEAPTTEVDDDEGYVRRAGQPFPYPTTRRRSPSPIHTIAPSPIHTIAPPRKRFGLTVPTVEHKYIGKFDFEEKYPEDPIYEELGPNARVWRANIDECEVYDNDMVTEARDGLDLLLVFAGLFSAVLTTFVAQTSQALSNNFPAVSTSLLLEMVTLQRALINGTSIDNISSTEMTSGPSGFDVWVNALWFTSLTLSLGTALMAVLVKQWLHQYMSATSGTSRDRSLIRQYRFEGLRKWRVLTIIGVLPVILHVALGVFLAGLVVLLIPLNVPLACVIGSITLVIYIAYAVSNVLPILYTQCPYRTPFSDTLNSLMRPVLCFVSLARASRIINRPIQLFFFSMAAASSSKIMLAISVFLTSAVAFAMGHIRKAFSAPTTETPFPPQDIFRTLKEAERIAATGDGVAEQVACDALVWLYQFTSNPPTKSVILQSIGGFSDNVSASLGVVKLDLEAMARKTIHYVTTPLGHFAVLPGQETRAERLLRGVGNLAEPPAADISQPQWVVDGDAIKPPFRLLISVLLHTRHVPVIWYIRPTGPFGGKGLSEWTPEVLLLEILYQYEDDNPILYPSAVWQRLFDSFRIPPQEEFTDIISLCRFALQNFVNGVQTVMPFADGVFITHGSVPLFKFVTTLLSRQSDVDSESLRGLLVMSESIFATLVPRWYDEHYVSTRALPTLGKVWQQIGKLSGLSTRDILALCCSAEKILLHQDSFNARFYEEGKDIYVTILEVAYRKTDSCITTPSLEAFKKLFWDMYQTGCFGSNAGHISRALCLVFDQSVDVPCYYNVFCALPLFSTQVVASLQDIYDYILPIVAAFVDGLARGTLPPDVPLRCMVYLCAEPDRLFTVCRILAMGVLHHDSPDSKRTLLAFARLIPSHVVWKSRAHYMLSKPQDWPYIRPSDTEYRDYQARGRIQLEDMLRGGLRVLDEFFASFHNPPLPVTCYLPGNSGAYIPFLQASPPTTSAFQPSSFALVDPATMEPNIYPLHHIYSDQIHTQSIVVPIPAQWETWVPIRPIATTPPQQLHHTPLVDEVLELEDGSSIHSRGHGTSDTPNPMVA